MSAGTHQPVTGSRSADLPVEYDERLLVLLRRALLRLEVDLERCAFIKSPVRSWIESLGAGSGAESYFLHRSATPVFLVPWWFELALNGSVDSDFHAAVMYSTVNLCYYVRILDDAVDGHAQPAQLLCALSFFHSRYQGSYIELFSASHPFWRYFFELNDLSCDVTAHDFVLKDLTRSDFTEITAKKSCAGLVAIAAIAAHYNRLEEFERWAEFWHAFGRWNQMRDDFFDWQKDFKSGIDTYFLSEARRRRRSNEDMAAWLIRDGIDWVADALREFARQAKNAAASLQSSALDSYLDSRFAETESQMSRLTRTMAAISACMK